MPNSRTEPPSARSASTATVASVSVLKAYSATESYTALM
jgi:hypothetical protein